MPINEQDQKDKELRQVVLDLLARDPRTAHLELRVGVLNGIVHLAGKAFSLESWNLVQKLAADLPETRGVVNRIQAPGAPSPARSIDVTISGSEE